MKMSVPVILSMMVSSLYNIIDSVFVSHLGESALTAMSLATPISSLLACITVGFSVGMNAALSRKLGEGDKEAANRAAGNGILINWIVSVLFMLFGFFLTRPFYALQTDIAEIQQLGYSYTFIVCIFSFGVANQTMLERTLVATGKPFGSVVAMLTGTVINLILDPILIFGYFGAPALGMQGAAIATDDEHIAFDFGYVKVEPVEAGFNSLHDVQNCVGYVLTFSNGKSVYVTGDTSKTEQMSEMADMNIDYAFYCCDGVYNILFCCENMGNRH